MHWRELTSRYGPSFAVILMLVTQTLADTKTKPATLPPEPTCRGGDEDVNICACDPQCARYGDCCRSSPFFVPEEQRLGASPFTCMYLFGKRLHVMARCPPEWKDSDTRNRCEHPDTNYRDPLLDAPVTSTSTNITYRNWHCASCHGDLDAKTTTIWAAKFQCSFKYGTPALNVSGEEFTKYLSYNSDTSQWNLDIDKSDLANDSGISILEGAGIHGSIVQQEYLYSCTLSFVPQEKEEFKTNRFCNPDIRSDCLGDPNATEEQKLCGEYTARVCSGDYMYRNYHCFLCNNKTPLIPCIHVFAGMAGYIPSFSMLLNFNRLKKRNECKEIEVYDPLQNVCRKVFK